MTIGMVGLGKMGGNMVRRLLKGGHTVVVFDLDDAARRAAANEGAVDADSLDAVVGALPVPRVVWVMVPAGGPTENTVGALGERLDRDDLIVDGGNSNYKDTLRRHATLAEKGIHFVDVGTSGGIWGLAEGYSMMVGGEGKAVARLRPILKTLAPSHDAGWGHVGPAGAGHFVKMVHNGIEYGMMQAFAEGFAIMKKKADFSLNLHQVAEVWRFGSVVRSWLLDLIARALAENPDLTGIDDWVPDSGEGRWTVFEAIDLDVPAPVISLSLMRRLASRDVDSFSDKLLAAMRNQFGGHAVKPE